MDPELGTRVAQLGRGGRDAQRRAGWVAVGVSGLWLVVAVVWLGVEAFWLRQDDHHHLLKGERWYEDAGILLLFVLIGIPVLTWIGAHLAVSLCLLRGRSWARPLVIGAFATSGLLPLWLLPGYLIGFVNAVLCAVVVAVAWPRQRR